MTKDEITGISIHVRLTDYKKHLSHYYNMSTISEEYLTTAMEYMSKKYKVNTMHCCYIYSYVDDFIRKWPPVGLHHYCYCSAKAFNVDQAATL